MGQWIEEAILAKVEQEAPQLLLLVRGRDGGGASAGNPPSRWTLGEEFEIGSVAFFLAFGRIKWGSSRWGFP